jgi:uncharacterized DUF497 family protein
MTDFSFERDQTKADINHSKHGVTFEEAVSVFYDDEAIEFYDEDHSGWEDRFLLLGMSANLRLLLVCHCHRAGASVIRIISARKATKRESQHYRR